MRSELKHFSQVLRAGMARQGINNSELARRVWGSTRDGRGFLVARNRDRIGHYLAGRSMPTPDNLQAIAQALGMAPDEFGLTPRVPKAGKTNRVMGSLCLDGTTVTITTDAVLDLDAIVIVKKLYDLLNSQIADTLIGGPAVPTLKWVNPVEPINK